MTLPASIDLVVDEREPIVMMVKTPRGALASARISEILQVANQAFRKNSGLRIDSMEIAGVDPVRVSECDSEKQLSCWSRLLLEDYARDSGRRPPKFLLVTSVIPDSDKGDRFSTLLIDLAEVQLIAEKVLASSDISSPNLEDLIFERAVETVAGFSLVADLQSTRAYFNDLVTQKLRRKLESVGEWLPFGEVNLLQGRGLIARLDGKVLGTLESDSVVLQGIRSGRRTLRLESIDGSIQPIEETVVVQPRQRIELLIKKKPNFAGIETSKKIMKWTGVGTAIIGAGIAATALALPLQSQTIKPCVGTDCDVDNGNQFARVCDYSFRELGEPCTGAGRVLLAPLGYSLMLSGVGLSSLSYIDDTSGDFRWWAPLTSIAIGAIAYGLSAL